MSSNPKEQIDQTSHKILRYLMDEGRLSYSELGRRIALSTPAVIERVQRLEEAGVIQGYHADVDPLRLGYTLTAFLRLHTTPESYPEVRALIENLPEVLECYHVTGEESFVMKIIAASTAHLEDIIAKFDPYGKTATSIILSTALLRRFVVE